MNCDGSCSSLKGNLVVLLPGVPERAAVGVAVGRAPWLQVGSRGPIWLCFLQPERVLHRLSFLQLQKKVDYYNMDFHSTNASIDL